MNHLTGQNLLPEGNAINSTYQNLYGLNSPALMAVTGANWLIAARTAYPRLRGANNLEIPDNKLPPNKPLPPTNISTTTRYEYICAYDGKNGNLPAGYGIYLKGSMGTGVTTQATKFEVDKESHIKCTSSYNVGGSIYNYSNPIILKETAL